MERKDPDDLLRQVIEQAQSALRRRDFGPQVEKIHRIVHVLERRIKRFEDAQYWSEVERAFEKAKGAAH